MDAELPEIAVRAIRDALTLVRLDMELDQSVRDLSEG